MKTYRTNIFKQVPTLKLLVPLCIGILLQYHLNIQFKLITYSGIVLLLLLSLFAFLSNAIKYKLNVIKALTIFGLFVMLGGSLAFVTNTKNNKNWLGYYLNKNTPIIVTLQDNIVEKEKSYKAPAKIEAILINRSWKKVDGNLLLYFKKDSTIPKIKYGSQIIIEKGIVPIINSGNPGGFNYAEYCSFQNIHFQGFLKDDDYKIIGTNKINWFANSIISSRDKALKILRDNIKEEDELSIAEALLIGYREELDKDLVKAYSNTGVVHIIAISGLHLGMIYGLIVLLFKPLSKKRYSKLIKAITIIFVLWMFSFIAGMAPSILRSAIMFSVIAVGELFDKKNNIHNGLALSAIVILIINPFSLWDVGFQLSYSAVLSIVIFSPYIKNWLYFENKILSAIWNLNAVTLSAQILTLSIVLYHFHQFPLLFLITNLIAVPLSAVILYAELLLMVFCWWKWLAELLGKCIEWLIYLMNKFIVFVNEVPFVVLESLQITIVQAMLLMVAIMSFAYWLMNKNKAQFFVALTCLLGFALVRSFDLNGRNQQHKLIVYNVPSHKAIDIVEGRNCFFVGDSIMNDDGFLKNFHIKPSRILHRVEVCKSLDKTVFDNNMIVSGSTKILLLNRPVEPKEISQKIKVNTIVVSKNPKLYINKLCQVFDFDNIVFDGSNSAWKINYWKKDCDSLKIKYHVCAEQGAYTLEL